MALALRPTIVVVLILSQVQIMAHAMNTESRYKQGWMECMDAGVESLWIVKMESKRV